MRNYFFLLLLIVTNLIGGYFFYDLVIHGHSTPFEGFIKTLIITCSIIIDVVYFVRNHIEF